MLDLSKPVQTKRGHPVRILATDVKGPYPIVGIVNSHLDYPASYIEAWTLNGRWGCSPIIGEGAYDLINVPSKKITMWLNVYKEYSGIYTVNELFYTKDAALFSSNESMYHTTVPVEFEE